MKVNRARKKMFKKQYQYIKQGIKIMSKDGWHEVVIDIPVCGDVIRKLQEEGYSVKVYPFFEGGTIIVGWNNEFWTDLNLEIW